MKKNGVALIIIFVVILLGGIFGILYLKYGNVELEKEESKVNLKYGIVSATNIKGENLYPYRVNDNYYIVEEDGKCGVVDSENKEVIPFLYNNCNFVNDVVIVENETTKYVLNMKNEVLFESEYNISYTDGFGSDKFYYFIIHDSKTDVYDENFKLLKTIDEGTYITIIDNYIIADDYIYLFDSEEKIRYGSLYYNDNYLIFDIRKKTGYEVYDIKNKKLVHYDKREENEYSMTFINDDNTLILDYDGNILKDGDKQKVLDKYYLDYSVCKSGFSFLDLEGNRLTNTCYSSYYEELLKYGVLLLSSYDDQIFDLVTTKGEIVTFETDDLYIRDKYLTVWDNENKAYSFYDLEGNKVEEVCNEGIDNLGKDRYLCSTPVTNYIVDEERNIINGPYDLIFCNDKKACVFKDYNGKYGVLFNDEVIIEPTFIDGTIYEDIIVLSGSTKNLVLKLGKSEKLLTKEELLFDEEIKYQEVDIDEVIKEYSLNDMEDIIKENEELFMKYSSVVLNNEKITKYRKEILNMFNVLVDRKSNLNEEYFLSGLKKLSIEEVKQIPISGAVGVYYDASKSIELLDTSYSVLAHEFMHFVDYNIDNSFDKNIYVCNEKYYSKDEVLELSLKEQSDCSVYYVSGSNNFIIEAGAEVNSYRYFDAMMDSYVDATVIYNALVYLYGEEFMESVYFSNDGEYQLFKKITNYISPDEYIKFINAAMSFTSNIGEYDVNNSKIVAETLIKLYKETIGGNWYEDKEFLFMINFIVNVYEKDIYNLEVDYLLDRMEILNNILNQIDGEYYGRISVPGIVTKDNKTYLNIPIWNEHKSGYLTIIYDFDNGKVLEHVEFYS